MVDAEFRSDRLPRCQAAQWSKEILGTGSKPLWTAVLQRAALRASKPGMGTAPLVHEASEV